jgi:hypothetical protein
MPASSQVSVVARWLLSVTGAGLSVCYVAIETSKDGWANPKSPFDVVSLKIFIVVDFLHVCTHLCIRRLRQRLRSLNGLLSGQEGAGSRVSMKQQLDVIVYAPYQYVAKSPAKLMRTLCIYHMSVLVAIHRTPPEIGVR